MYQPFSPNQEIKRSSIHDQYGGNRQSGISPCANFPYIFIFTGLSGHQHGYQDAWDNHKVFSYTGEGQSGDMEFVKGNLALREHLNTGKRVFLFQNTRKAYVRFTCELEIIDFDFFSTHDSSGTTRQAIRFFFKKKGTVLDIEPQDLDLLSVDESLPYHVNFPNVTERQGLVISRVGQGAYRKSILHRWDYKCAVTGFDNIKILVASHIVPWRDSTNSQRLDIHNGILLSPTYDALFDKNLISFENNGKIILSENIKREEFLKIGVTGKEQIKNISVDNIRYLEKHRLQLLA